MSVDVSSFQTVYRTRHYDKFVQNKEQNRDINPNHVINLKKELKKNNFLESAPILINRDFVILDGLHRFTAAKELGIDLFYRVDPTLTMEKVICANAANLKWQIKDYLKFYANNQLEGYVFVDHLCKKYKRVKLSTIFVAMGILGTESWKKFRDGEFVIPKYVSKTQVEQLIRNAILVMEFLNKSLIKYKSMVETQMFQHALVLFLKREEVNVSCFLGKLGGNISKVLPRLSVSDYEELFKYLYDFKNKDENKKFTRRKKVKKPNKEEQC